MSPVLVLLKYLLIFIYLLYSFVSLKYELRMMPENSCRNGGYVKWLKRDFLSFNRLTDFLLVVALFVALYVFSGGIYFWVVTLTGLALFIKGIILLRRSSEKPMVFTLRAKWFYIAACVLVVVMDTMFYLLFPAYLFGGMMLAAWLSSAIMRSLWVRTTAKC